MEEEEEEEEEEGGGGGGEELTRSAIREKTVTSLRANECDINKNYALFLKCVRH